MLSKTLSGPISVITFSHADLVFGRNFKLKSKYFWRRKLQRLSFFNTIIIIFIIIDTFPVQLLFWSKSDCVLKQNSDKTIFIMYQGQLIFACFRVWKFFIFLTLDYRYRNSFI